MPTPIPHIDLGPLPRTPQDDHPHPTGLGDLVGAAAQPIARAIDRIAGTDLAHCGGCAARKAALNAAVPDIRHPLRR